MPSLKDEIESRFDQLEEMMLSRSYAEAEELLPSITKLTSILTEEQRDFIGAARLAIEENLDWFN